MQLSIILEGYGRTYDFPYQNFGTDPRPRVLLLGKYRHPTTGNINIGGINLNYLDDDQLKELRQNLKTILQPKNLQLRYWRGRRLLPDIFTSAYRTYNTDYVGAVTKDTLTFWPSIGELDQAERAAKDQDMQQYDKDMRTKHKIGRMPAVPEPEPLPEVPSVEPEADPKGPAPAADVELARPETEVTSEPTPGAGKQQKQKPIVPQEPTQTDPAGPATQQSKMEAPPAGPMVRGGKGRRGKETPGAGAPAQPPTQAPEKMTSAQRRRQQAEQIKKATDASKKGKKRKPDPPDDLRGIMGMFKPPNK